jgi:hypothetical protein
MRSRELSAEQHIALYSAMCTRTASRKSCAVCSPGVAPSSHVYESTSSTRAAHKRVRTPPPVNIATTGHPPIGVQWSEGSRVYQA